jgi:gliding motility-associated-like protein
MKAFLILILTLTLSGSGFSQLVNGGFEMNSSIPMLPGSWSLLYGWNNAASIQGSPDYYHILGSVSTDLPETPLGNVIPAEGEAIVGMVVCSKPGTDYREYLTAVFTQPLEVGKQYMVGFMMTNGNYPVNFSTTSGLGVDKIGLSFSTTQPVQSGSSPIHATPQCVIDSVFYSRNWESINFVFTADQAYSFMTIGLFGDDSDKQIVQFNGQNPDFAYYFIDKFYLLEIDENYDPLHPANDRENHDLTDGSKPVIDDSSLDPFFVPNTFTPNGDTNNEVLIPVANYATEWNFCIYSRWGQLIFCSADITKGWDGTYFGSMCDTGVYVWEVTYYEIDDQQGKVEKVSRGIVNLVR